MIKAKRLKEYRLFIGIAATLLVSILAFRFIILPGTTFARTSFELMEATGGWQIFDPYRQNFGYTGSMFTTDEQASDGNFSLKYSVSTSYNHESIGEGLERQYVSTVALVLFFANPTLPTDISFEYEYNDETYTRSFNALDPILKSDLIINPHFECYFWAIETTAIRIDITAWDDYGEPMGRGTTALSIIDPDSEQYGWIHYKQNIVTALNSEVGDLWAALRSIEIRLYDDRSVMQPLTYSDNSLEMYMDNFIFYTGDPYAKDFEDNQASRQWAPFGAEGIVFGIPMLILYKKVYKKEEDELNDV